MVPAYKTPPDNVNRVNHVMMLADRGIPRSCGGLKVLIGKGVLPRMRAPRSRATPHCSCEGRITSRCDDRPADPLKVGCQSHGCPGNIKLDRDGYLECTFRFLFHGTVDMDADNGVGPY